MSISRRRVMGGGLLLNYAQVTQLSSGGRVLQCSLDGRYIVGAVNNRGRIFLSENDAISLTLELGSQMQYINYISIAPDGAFILAAHRYGTGGSGSSIYTPSGATWMWHGGLSMDQDVEHTRFVIPRNYRYIMTEPGGYASDEDKQWYAAYELNTHMSPWGFSPAGHIYEDLGEGAWIETYNACVNRDMSYIVSVGSNSISLYSFPVGQNRVQYLSSLYYNYINIHNTCCDDLAENIFCAATDYFGRTNPVLLHFKRTGSSISLINTISLSSVVNNGYPRVCCSRDGKRVFVFLRPQFLFFHKMELKQSINLSGSSMDSDSICCDEKGENVYVGLGATSINHFRATKI